MLTPPKLGSAVAFSEEDRAPLARELSSELAVGAVLYGHVVKNVPPAEEGGWRTEEPRRLFLYMIDRLGHLLWKDELPFVIVTGGKPSLEDSVQQSLTRPFMDHVRAVGLVAAGYLPATAS